MQNDSSANNAFPKGKVLPNPTLDAIKNTTRHATIEAGLTEQQVAMIVKAEGKDAKNYSKILKNEAKAQAKLHEMAMKELTNLQKIEKTAITNEAAAIKAHAQVVKSGDKANRAYLDAKAKWEIAAAELSSKTEKLEAARRHSQEQTALLKEKTKEVEQLRMRKATDDRERLMKLSTLANQTA
ncbi:hypothetical protein FRB95_014842 [Tulasnella sp. JGI-2019a]|nr:hypothetical protein FRB95_014842 [Tulasnella sp. JGI-2019a]